MADQETPSGLSRPRKRRKRPKKFVCQAGEASIKREERRNSSHPWPAKLTFIRICTLLLIHAHLLAAHKRDGQTAQVQAKLPAGASCQLHPVPADADEDLLAREFGFRAAPGRLTDLLKQRTEISVQDKSKWASENRSLVRQSAFSSICQGWRNSLPLGGGAHQSDAYWVLDESRGVLVAKFLYIDKHDWLEARLTSPIFHPIPPYHSLQESRYFNSCRVSFRAYLTIEAQLELALIPVPTTGPALAAQSEPGARLQEHSQITLKSVIEGKASRGRGQAKQYGEQAAWSEHWAQLPMHMSQPYKLEFSAMTSIITGASTALNYAHLNGVAIANFSLSPECFALAVDQSELARLNYSAPASWPLVPMEAASASGLLNKQEHANSFQRKLAHLFDANKTSILACVILFLVIVVAASQYLICYHLGPCWSRGRGRKRVYASELGPNSGSKRHLGAPNGRASHLARPPVEPHHQQHLRPLRVAFEDVELKDNPSYFQSPPGSHYLAKAESVPLEPYRIDRKRLQMIKPLGKGAFGEVYQGRLLCYCTDNPADDEQLLVRDGQLELRTRDELDRFESHWMSVAVKTLTDERMTEQDFIREAINMSQVSHRNIVELIGVCVEEKPPYIVMELLAGGNLKNFLLRNRDKGRSEEILTLDYYQNDQRQRQDHSPWSPPNTPTPGERAATNSARPGASLCMGDLLVFALDIARACDYLQRRQFIHRDLAARNCLLTSASKNLHLLSEGAEAQAAAPRDEGSRNFVGQLPSALDVDANHKVDLESIFLNGYKSSGIVAKLADFGMTRDVYTNDYYRMGHKELPVRWMPPECLDGVATTKSDVWSFGVFLWELMSMGQMPYQDMLDNRQVIEFIKSRRHKRPSRQPSNQPPALAGDAPAPERHLMALSAQIDENTDHSALRLLPLPGESCTDLYAAASFTTAACEQPTSLVMLDRLVGQADSPPLPPPHDNTPHSIYAIMCSCWATNPDERPQFCDIANRLYWCLQKSDVLSTSLPCFYE